MVMKLDLGLCQCQIEFIPIASTLKLSFVWSSTQLKKTCKDMWESNGISDMLLLLG